MGRNSQRPLNQVDKKLPVGGFEMCFKAYVRALVSGSGPLHCQNAPNAQTSQSALFQSSDR